MAASLCHGLFVIPLYNWLVFFLPVFFTENHQGVTFKRKQ